MLIMLGFVGLLGCVFTSNTLLVRELGFLSLARPPLVRIYLTSRKKEKVVRQPTLVYLQTAEPLREYTDREARVVIVP